MLDNNKCECRLNNFCDRRGITISPLHQRLCKAGRGDVVDRIMDKVHEQRTATQKAYSNSGSVPVGKPTKCNAGTLLSERISGLLGVKGTQGCGCKKLAKEMDDKGLEWCRKQAEPKIIPAMVANKSMIADAFHVPSFIIDSAVGTKLVEIGARRVLNSVLAEAVEFLPRQLMRMPQPEAKTPVRLLPRVKSSLSVTTIRVGLASHGFYTGGVEEWFRALVSGNADPKIQYTAVGVIDQVTTSAHRSLAVPIVPHADLHNHCDVIIGWATNLQHLRHWPGKIVYISHGSTNWTAGWLNRYVDFADAIVAVSQSARSVVDATNDRVQVIQNGVDLSRLITPADRNVTTPTLGFLGRWSPEKNGQLVAEAARLIGCRAAFLVPNNKHSGARHVIRDYGIDADWYTTRQLKTFLSKISCLVVPSRHEGGPLVVAEAWASGIPVAATQVGMIPELEAIHGQLCVPLSNPPTSRELKSILLRIDPEVTARAYNVATEHLTKERMAAEYAALIHSLFAPSAKT